MNLIISLRPFGYWYSPPATLHTEGECHETGKLEGIEVSKQFFPPFRSMYAVIQMLQPKGDSNVLQRNAASLTHKHPYQEESNLFNSLQPESLKCKRGFSSANFTSGLQRAWSQLTAASIIEKE